MILQRSIVISFQHIEQLQTHEAAQAAVGCAGIAVEHEARYDLDVALADLFGDLEAGEVITTHCLYLEFTGFGSGFTNGHALLCFGQAGPGDLFCIGRSVQPRGFGLRC